MQRKVGSQIGKEPTTPKESGHEASRFLIYYKLRLLRLVLLAAGKDTLVFCKHADSSPRKRFFFSSFAGAVSSAGLSIYRWSRSCQTVL